MPLRCARHPRRLALAQKMINDLDRPKKAYRLTYTITDIDGGKRIGVQHFSTIVTEGQRTVVKQVSKVPMVTGSYNNSSSQTESQVTYLDVGLIFDSTLASYGGGASLRSKVEQSSVAEERSGVGPQDPVVRIDFGGRDVISDGGQAGGAGVAGYSGEYAASGCGCDDGAL